MDNTVEIEGKEYEEVAVEKCVCDGCAFENVKCFTIERPCCSAENRTDELNVIFVEIEDDI